jgi:hypothetical protein
MARKNTSSKKLSRLGLFLAIFIFLGLTFIDSVKAQTVTPPTFPRCEDRIFSVNGDMAHYDTGIHGIPGVGNREGSDDVYVLTENNFLQCFCPVEGSGGIQSNWWNVSGLSETEITRFRSEGWLFETSGSGWNLPDDPFLIQNRNFSCVKPTPTLTPTTAPLATPTRGPQGPISRCYDLEASPFEGSAPLTVKFTAHADDPSQQGKIKEYRFDYGDAASGQQVVFQTDRESYHKYEKSGEYQASVRIQDFAGNWRESDECKVTIKVSAAPQVLGANTPETLPAAGVSLVTLLVGISLGFVGHFLIKQFKLV